MMHVKLDLLELIHITGFIQICFLTSIYLYVKNVCYWVFLSYISELNSLKFEKNKQISKLNTRKLFSPRRPSNNRIGQLLIPTLFMQH